MIKLDRYIGGHLLRAFLLVTLVLAPLFTFLDFIQQLNDVGKRDFELADALRYEAALFPRHILDLFPVIALLGTTLALLGLARTQELIAIRAAGISVARAAWAVSQVMIVLIMLAVALEEEFVSPLQQKALQIRHEKLTGSQFTRHSDGLWMHRESRYVNIGEIKDGFVPADIEIFEFDQDQRLELFLRAETADIADPEQWLLKDVILKRRENGKLMTETLAETVWEPYLGPDEIDLLELPSGSLSLLQTRRYVAYLEASGQSTERHMLSLWQKFTLPVASLTLALIGVPFAFGSMRSGSGGKRLILAMVAGVAYLLGNQILSNVAIIYDIRAPLVTMLPTLAILGSAVWLIRRAR